MPPEPSPVPEFEYATVRSDDAAKWVGRDGWEVIEQHAVHLRRIKPVPDPDYNARIRGLPRHARCLIEDILDALEPAHATS